MKISEIILEGLNRDYLLPSIQREFVWLINRKEKRIEKLFDSIMQGYPIGSILVWDIVKDPEPTAIKFEVYNFIQNYDKDDPHNEISNLHGYKKIHLILDGQQRLSALNLGLKGRYIYTSNKKKREEKLYINLLTDIENDPYNEYGFKYEFKFMEEIPDNNEQLWIEVGTVLNYHDNNTEEFKEIFENSIREKTNDENKIRKAKLTLGNLHIRFCCENKLIVENVTADDEIALNIFVRMNDGGVKLEKADLLLSYMEANKEIFRPKGARKEITDFVDLLNKENLHKPNYCLYKDDILKAALVMTDLEVQYKIKNFDKNNLTKISNNWETIKKYLEITIELIARYGFSYKNIISNNSLIPIAYYLKIRNFNKDFIASQDINILKIKTEIIKWLVISQITGAFGSSSDTTLKNIREALKNNKSFDDINLRKVIQRENVEKWINRESYGSKYSHLLLLLITSNKYWDTCHQDHIFPDSKFKKKEYIERKFSDNKIEFYEKNRNSIVNLQLLNPSVNIAKTNDNFIDWSNSQNKEFLESSLIPIDKEYSFELFEEFINVRKKLMINKIYDILKPELR